MSQIGQAEIDAGAVAVYPFVTPATRSRQFYTPVSSVLHHALGDKCPLIKRPKGSKGREKTDFRWPADAFANIDEAEKIDPEFGLNLLLLFYTGVRRSEGLNMLPQDVKP